MILLFWRVVQLVASGLTITEAAPTVTLTESCAQVTLSDGLAGTVTLTETL